MAHYSATLITNLSHVISFGGATASITIRWYKHRFIVSAFLSNWSFNYSIYEWCKFRGDQTNGSVELGCTYAVYTMLEVALSGPGMVKNYFYISYVVKIDMPWPSKVANSGHGVSKKKLNFCLYGYTHSERIYI
jgi:hypothetical protein